MNKILLGLFYFFFILPGYAKQIPPKPQPPKLVNDFVNVMGEQERSQLEQKLLAYSDSTSTQIAIVIEPSLEGDDVFDYSVRLAEAWQIGMKGKNNGILIYVATEDRKIRIQNGYGMEATVTDALSKRIIEEVIKPNFRANNYYQGLDEATTIIMRAASGEYVNENPKTGKADRPPTWVIILIVILVLTVLSRKGKGRSGRIHGPGPFLGTFGGGGFSGGGFGGGGGGFGGFGGGSFGGGGAGGSW